jgi:hypothetical protein
MEFFPAYMAVALAAWTIGNTDALYSRFLYPSYV